MRAVDDEIETIHLYVVREQEKRPYTAFPLVCAFVCLLAIAGITAYSATHPSYEHERLRVPAILLPLKVFTAEVPMIPTGVKTYPATSAHGYLTFSNGSVIGQSIPQGFTIGEVATDSAIDVPGATANGFGMATVAAHLLAPGINMPTLSINEVVGASLFIRNLSPFIGGRPAYSVKYITPQDRQTALNKARQSITAQKFRIIGYLTKPCKELENISSLKQVSIVWDCQFATYKVPSYMRVLSAKLVGTQFFVDVVFVARPRPVQSGRK